MSAGPNAQYTYNDNNIIFIIEHLPANGTLVRNGLPMTKSARFTQAELAAGIVKYIHNGQGTRLYRWSIHRTNTYANHYSIIK